MGGGFDSAEDCFSIWMSKLTGSGAAWVWSMCLVVCFGYFLVNDYRLTKVRDFYRLIGQYKSIVYEKLTTPTSNLI